MTQLLVSVRTRAECAAAMATSVDVIDVKEPSRGSLGAADLCEVVRIVEEVAERRPVSVALGELRELDVATLAAVPRVEYVKIGLARCAGWSAWPAAWYAAWERVPGSPRRVAVLYADAKRADAPTCRDVLAAARDAGCDVLLVDTFDKSSGGLLDLCSLEQLEELREVTRAESMQLALAGSLTRQNVTRLVKMQPDFVAVRTAVCHRGREGTLSQGLVEVLATDVRLANESAVP